MKCGNLCRSLRALQLLAAAALVASFGLWVGCADTRLPAALGGSGVKPHTEGERMMFREIDSAADREFEPDKTREMAHLAAQSSLAENVQVYLVFKTFKDLSFDDDRITVLRALIRNPAFAPAARTRIVKMESEFSFDNSRTAIDGELARHSPVEH